MEMISLAGMRDAGAQMRVEMRVETVQEYAQDMLEGASFPPVIVYHDGTDYWLGDGYHRVDAARKIGRETIAAEVRQGTARDAILCGVGSNASHGLRRTQVDKRRAVERLLSDPEWSQWSDRKIAKAACVDNKTVAAVRRDLVRNSSPQASKGGEFPIGKGKAKVPAGGNLSLVESLLHTLPDDALVAECRRRRLTVLVDAA